MLGDDSLIEALNRRYEEISQQLQLLSAARLLIVRTRFVDARLDAALQNGASQVVMLGAGFDRCRNLTAGEPWIFGLPANGNESFSPSLG